MLANGTPVQVYVHNLSALIVSSDKNPRYDCNNTPAQGWRLNSLGTQVVLWGTDFCLDAGSSECHNHLIVKMSTLTHKFCTDPGNGVGMKIWKCYDIPAQSWYWTDDNRLALLGKGGVMQLSYRDAFANHKV